MKRVLFAMVAGSALIAALPLPRAGACIHPPKDFKFAVENGPQRGIVMWENGRQELVMMPGYAVGSSKDPDAKLDIGDDGMVRDFTGFGWLVPLPEVPDGYKEASKTIFKDMHEFTRVRPRLEVLKGEDGPVISGDAPSEDGIKFLEAVSIGEYLIQPIKAKGDAGATELKAWLKENSFGEVSDGTLRWYVQRQWCWLAIKLSSAKGLPEAADAKPLQISFKTPRPVYPLKVNDGRGAFDAEIWVITRERIDLAKSRAFGLRTPEQDDDYYMQENRETGFVKLPQSVQDLSPDSEDFKGLRLGAIYCYRFSGKGYESSKGEDVGAWLDDMSFYFEREAAAKPAQEVKPTPAEEPKPPGDKPPEKPPEGK